MAGDFEDDEDSPLNKLASTKKVAIWLVIIFGTILLFLPSKNEMVFIIAGGKTLDFVQQDSSLNKVPSLATKAVVDYLEKEIKNTEKSSED